jgi:hypothetical protein
VEAALPAGEVRTDHDFRLAVFNLARHLKRVPELRDRPAKDLRPWVQQWHQRAGGRLGGRSFVETYSQFIGGWKGVRYAAGDDVVKLAWEFAQQQPPPPEAADYDDPRIGQLLNLCRHLQRQNEMDGPGGRFYLSGRVAGTLLGVSQPTAAKWLKMLDADGLLEVADPGGGFRGGRRMAREYRVVERR